MSAHPLFTGKDPNKTQQTSTRIAGLLKVASGCYCWQPCENGGRQINSVKFLPQIFLAKMYAAPCSPSSSIFSEMLELNAMRLSSKRDYSEEEQLSVGSYDAAKSSPVFFGRYGHKLSESVAEVREVDDGASTRSSIFPEFDPSVNHPATFGYVLLDRKPAPPKQESPPSPDPKECKLRLSKVLECRANCFHIFEYK